MATTEKAKPNIIPTWQNILIFGFGETQLIGELITNKTFKNSELLKLQEAIDYIYSLKPIDNLTPNDFRLISIVKDFEVKFVPSDSSFEEFQISWENIDTTTIDALAIELMAEPLVEEANI
jgi:hypothetical protein